MIIGCDYSTKAIHLSWIRDARWYTCVIKNELIGEELESLRIFFRDRIIEGGGYGEIFIEKPFTRGNAWTGVMMQRMATIIEVMATLAGFEIHWANTQAWRSKVFGKGKYKKAQAKQLVIEKALELTGQKHDDDTADSICIALYGMESE